MIDKYHTPLVVPPGSRAAAPPEDIAPPPAARLALPASEERFRTLVEMTSDWVWAVDENGRYTYASPKLKDLLGYEPEEVLGKTPFDLMPPAEAARLAPIFAAIVSAKQPFSELENINLHKDGHEVMLETSGVPILDAAGELRGYQGIDRDITERKLVEKVSQYQLELRVQERTAQLQASHHALRESQDELTAIYENAPLIMMLLDSDRRVRKVNQYAETFTNEPGAGLIGLHPGEALRCLHALESPDGCGWGPHCRDCLVRQTALDCLETGRNHHQLEATLACQVNGQTQYLTFLLSAARLNVREQPHVLVTLQDITRRKKVEVALAESEEKFRRLFNTITDAILVVDAETRQVVEVNEAACQLYGYTREEFLRLTHLDLTAEPEDSEAAIRLALANAAPHVPLRYHKKKGGAIFSVEISASAFLLQGRPVGCGIIRDITARQRAEEMLHRREQELTDFFAESPLGLLWVQPSGRILRVNRAQLELLGYAAEEVRGRPVAEFHADAEAATDLLDRLAKRETVRDYRVRLRHKNGSILHVLIDANGFWEKDRLLHSRWFVRDITRRVELEREILDISEREQRRLGHDLHDDLCQQLAGIQFLSQTLASDLAAKSKAAAQAREIAQMVQQAMTQTRELARGLSPVRLESDGLMDALRQLAAHTKKIFHRDCAFLCAAPVAVPNHLVAIHLYRIAQEAVANAIKHGKARRIEIGLTAGGRNVTLGVKDNGIGLARKPRAAKGMGLRIMQYRAGVIGGRLTVQRDPAGGTRVTCTVREGLQPPASVRPNESLQKPARG